MLSSVIITGEQAILIDSTIDVSGISDRFVGTASKTISRNLTFTFTSMCAYGKYIFPRSLIFEKMKKAGEV